MERVLPSLFDDLDDVETVPGVCIEPEWVVRPGAEADPLLEDPSSWEEDTKRFRMPA